MTLPYELLSEIFKYFEYDYKLLHSCILVNKLWHSINTPILWKDPFFSVGSIKLLINCLLVEDEDFLRNNNIELKNFQLLEKPPLYNYANFTTDLKFWGINNKLAKLIGDYNIRMINLLKKRLADFILDYSTIRILRIIGFDIEWPINHPKFSICFQNLYELECDFFRNDELLDKLAHTCKNIQVLRLCQFYDPFDDCKDDYYLVQLIKAQNKIKGLVFNLYSNLFLSTEFKKSLLTHSKSIIDYLSYGENNLNSLLIPTFQNLKILKLNTHSYSNMSIDYLKSASLPNIEVVDLSIFYQQFLLDLSEFIEINGNNIITLNIGGNPIIKKYLRELLNSIGQKCHNLENLEIFYNNELDNELFEIVNNCKKLKYIKFRKNCRLDGDKIFNVLNLALPTKLKTIIFENEIFISSHHPLDFLIDNWRGPKPFKIIELLKDNRSLFSKQIKKYQDLKFLELENENY